MILEFNPRSTRGDRAIFSGDRPAEWELQEYKDFQRLLLIQITTGLRGEGEIVTHTSYRQDKDSYRLIIKTPTFSDTREVLSDLRAILDDQPFNDTYNRVELRNMSHLRIKYNHYYICDVDAFFDND